MLTARFPAGPDISADDLLAMLTQQPAEGPLAVGDDRVRDFLIAFSRQLLRPEISRRFPELGSLGFFLRRGEIAKSIERLHDGSSGSRFVPRGLVLHFPPANVDTIFVYSWAMSALAGNANIVRISSRSAGAAEVVIDTLNATLAQAHPAIGQTQRIVSYERSDSVTASLSFACDLRVIWGGDRSVTDIRRHPLAPLARDLAFPDRSSFAAISVRAWLAAEPETKRRAVEGFANDVYWFDQAACSSPRALFWVGEPGRAQTAREEFMSMLPGIVAGRGWQVDAAMAVEKRVRSYGLAAEGAASRVRFTGNAVADIDLASPAQLPRRWLGAGTICHATVGTLSDQVPLVRRKDQTLTQFGFSAQELDGFVTEVAGRGIDRIVPFGSALTFSGVWDGYDLLREFTRQTTIWV